MVLYRDNIFCQPLLVERFDDEVGLMDTCTASLSAFSNRCVSLFSFLSTIIVNKIGAISIPKVTFQFSADGLVLAFDSISVFFNNCLFVLAYTFIIGTKALKLIPVVLSVSNVGIGHLVLYNSFVVIIYCISLGVSVRIKFFFFFCYVFLAAI